MQFQQKLETIHQVYDIYSSYADSLDLACREHCCQCCTRNVTLTSLEAANVLDRLDPADGKRFLQQIQLGISMKRFQPLITTNQLAEKCARGEALPEEPSDSDWGPCPLLEKDSCPLYNLRPFACRCLISRNRCDHAGHADIDEFSLTVNSLILQVIEHIDSDGCTGNLTDMLLYLSKPEKMHTYRQGRIECTAANLIRNRPLKILMVPPYHRERAMPLLHRLQRLGLG